MLCSSEPLRGGKERVAKETVAKSLSRYAKCPFSAALVQGAILNGRYTESVYGDFPDERFPPHDGEDRMQFQGRAIEPKFGLMVQAFARCHRPPLTDSTSRFSIESMNGR